MNSMKSFAAALQNSLRSTAGSSELAAKAARANKVKQMWREAVDPVFLDHTNSVYIIREGDEKTLIVYVDDSIFAAELNARRELIKLKFFQRFNEKIDEFKILISRGRYKQNYPFRNQDGDPFYIEPAQRVPLSEGRRAEIEDQCACIPDERLRKSLMKAMISDLEWKSGIEKRKINN